VDVPCGEGPVVEIDGEPRATSVHTTLGGLRRLQPVELGLCADGASTGQLGAGEHRFAALSSDAFTAVSATLVRADVSDEAVTGGRTAVEASRWDAEHRAVQVRARSEATLLVVPENFNPGWVATLDGSRLEAQTVDGWQQGYVLPAGRAGEVRLDFGPGTTYRAALLVGAAGVVLLAVLLLVPARRPGPPPTGRRTAGAGVAVSLIAGTAVIGGVVGLAALGLAVAVAWAAGTYRPLVLGLLTSTAMLAAGVVALVTGTVWQATPGPGVPIVQALVLVALSGVVASLVAVRRRDRSGTSARQRRTGRSATA
jgi:arabinofuranan 3-O-arabinosyltransferase